MLIQLHNIRIRREDWPYSNSNTHSVEGVPVRWSHSWPNELADDRVDLDGWVDMHGGW